jgi:hypothetical protein
LNLHVALTGSGYAVPCFAVMQYAAEKKNRWRSRRQKAGVPRHAFAAAACARE